MRRTTASAISLTLVLAACHGEEPRFRARSDMPESEDDRATEVRVTPPPTRPPAPPTGTQVPPPPDVAAPPADAVRTESGLASRVIGAGTGADHPGARDRVTVHYTGWTTDGVTFDTSRDGEPAAFPLDRVIAGWTEGLQLMVVGEQRRFWIPEELAYRGRAGAPAGMLVFDVELLSFAPAPPAPPPPVAQAAPPDVAAPPAIAERTPSGLASRVITRGTGTRHPLSTSVVEVHYTGWTTDGRMFDSSRTAGHTVEFPLTSVIAGWTEGVQLMVEGETRRFWIPQDLAYQGRPGPPAGMLVFDVQLVRIVR